MEATAIFGRDERCDIGGQANSEYSVQQYLSAIREEGRLPPGASADLLRDSHLIGEDLSELNLSGLDLSGADLSRANLSHTKLVGAQLKGTVLFEADLTGCELLSANLAGANLNSCRADNAGFESADLTGATLFNAGLNAATFTKAILRDADLRATEFVDARLREVDLRGANLSRANLFQADLEGSNVSGATFMDTNLCQTHLGGMIGYAAANWVGADVHDVNFTGAYLTRRAIMDQNYLHEFRNQSRASAIVYWIWWVTSDCGRSFLRWGGWISILACLFTVLFQFVVLDYGDHPTILSSFYYSVVTLTTLGYGDVVPASVGAQLLAIIEVLIGYVMLGGLLSIFANKMSRRAD